MPLKPFPGKAKPAGASFASGDHRGTARRPPAFALCPEEPCGVSLSALQGGGYLTGAKYSLKSTRYLGNGGEDMEKSAASTILGVLVEALLIVGAVFLAFILAIFSMAKKSR